MRVGVVGKVPDQTAGGAWTFMSEIYRALTRSDSAHEFVWLDTSRPHSFFQSIAANILRGARKGVSPLRRRSRLRDGIEKLSGRLAPINKKHARLEQWVTSNSVDVVWFTSPHDEIVSVPYMTTVWDLGHRIIPFFPEFSVTGWGWSDREKRYRTVLPRASVVLTGTHAGKSEIERCYGVHPDNIEVVPFFAPRVATGAEGSVAITDLAAKSAGLENYLLYPAQFWPHKNHVNLLHALKQLVHEDGISLKLVLTGSDKGNNSHVRSIITELGLEDHVKLLGFVSRDELEALYRNAFALIFPSFLGPDNIPPLEAFALRCPVIAARVAGAQEQFGEAALLFEPADVEDMCRAILNLHASTPLRQSLIERGARIAAERTPDVYVASINRILNRLCIVRRCWGATYREY